MDKEYRDWCVVSLGCDCEVDFRFRHFSKRVESFLFSYAAVLNPFGFVNLLGSLNSITEADFFPYKRGMLVNYQHGIAFHLKNQDSWPIVVRKDDMTDFRGRLLHLLEKTKQLFSDSSARIVFVQKIPYCWMSNGYFNSLFDQLCKCVSGDFRLVFIVEKRYVRECRSYLPNDRKILLESVKRFSVPSKRGDMWAWLRICKKYTSGSSARYICSTSPFFRTILLPCALRLTKRKRDNVS